MIRLGHRTKALIARLQPGDIALIHHSDLDEVAADALRRARVQAVINGGKSITGRYPNLGPSLLLAAGVPLMDVAQETFRALRDGDAVRVDDEGRVFCNDRFVGRGRWLTAADIERQMEKARANLPTVVEDFIDNTLVYASREKHFVVRPFPLPRLSVSMKGRHVLVVVRGHRHREDLAALRSYIADVNPVLIGVDGGADAIVDAGWRPHIIVGDMDSVSDNTLPMADDIIVHAYADGQAPGLTRTKNLGLSPKTVAAPGTSEDVAMLLAYEAGAQLIVAVGTHSNLIDFLEKGRPGMASTFLVRLKVGNRLIDARGVSKLYRATPRLRYPLQITLAAMVPTLIVIALGGPVGRLLRLAWLQLRVLFGW